jgi:hypothetical protein
LGVWRWKFPILFETAQFSWWNRDLYSRLKAVLVEDEWWIEDGSHMVVLMEMKK